MHSLVADQLGSVFAKTETIIAAVRPDQLGHSTPCAELSVADLLDHMVGWARNFAARVSGEEPPADPGAYQRGPDAAGEFHDATRTLVRAFRDTAAGDVALPPGMLLMEFIGHGWDLATATGQRVPFSDDEVAAALEAGRRMLKPDYRGPDKAFAVEVDPPDDATPTERLVAFLGRDPRWERASS